MKTFGFYSIFFLLNKFILIPFVFLLLSLSGCDNPKATFKKEEPLYLNHADTAKYIGMSACKLCHQSVYDSFIQTGMGRSIALASQKHSSADFSNATLYDESKQLHYNAYWEKDSMYMLEYRLSKKDTVHARLNKVNYIIGSGQHTNSHLLLSGQYLSQMPMTYYTQKGKWDLPPGFENGVNTRFSRKIGLECMSCHNAYPDFVMGSENKYTSIPQGIDCERCHGPGSIHVAQRLTGSKIDTSKYIDYSIVNPSKLPIDLQFDICQRCHLQGNTILKEGKSFYDFKPGQKLSDVMTVFLPKYEGAEDEFIMASHADRLKQSACFIKSAERAKGTKALKPYKNALTCITCHNPHVSVKSTRSELFDRACINCHGSAEQMAESHKQIKQYKAESCYTCHMPVSGSTDIPHVTVHDHYIRVPLGKEQKQKIKRFIGLYAVNEKNPEPLVRAKAYLNQYDKFEQNIRFLDSAAHCLNACEESASKFQVDVQLNFTQGNYSKLLQRVNRIGAEKIYKEWCGAPSYDNAWAWTCYRIAEAYNQSNQTASAVKWFSKAVELAPYQLDFRNKLGNALANTNQISEAKAQFKFILKENPSVATAYSNLAYLLMLESKFTEAKSLLKSGLKLDPDNENLMLNLVTLLMQSNDKMGAKLYLERVLQLNKNNRSAQMALKRLESEP
jgi:Tfp pilus assembly protein PilF